MGLRDATCFGIILCLVSDDTEPDEVGVKVTIRELDEVLMRDVGDRIRKDGRQFSNPTLPD